MAVILNPLSPLLAYGALALAALFWAGNMLTGSAVHVRISPALLSVWRWLAILLLLFPFVSKELHRRARELLLAWRMPVVACIVEHRSFQCHGVSELASHQRSECGASVLPPANSRWAIGYLAIFPSILATLLYNRALDVLGPARASHCIHLVPVYACLLGAIVLGDPIHPYHLTGFVLIVAGLGIAAASRQKA